MSKKTHESETGRNTTGTRTELRELLSDFRTAMLVTIDGKGFPRARPLAIAKIEDDDRVWFATPEHTPKVDEIAADSKVAVLCHRTRDQAWISLSGTARLLRDPAMARDLWDVGLKAWFAGPDDPALLLIEVRPIHAEYYEAHKPLVARAVEMVRGILSNEPPDMGPTKHVVLDRLSEPGRLSY